MFSFNRKFDHFYSFTDYNGALVRYPVAAYAVNLSSDYAYSPVCYHWLKQQTQPISYQDVVDFFMQISKKTTEVPPIFNNDFRAMVQLIAVLSPPHSAESIKSLLDDNDDVSNNAYGVTIGVKSLAEAKKLVAQLEAAQIVVSNYHKKSGESKYLVWVACASKEHVPTSTELSNPRLMQTSYWKERAEAIGSTGKFTRKQYLQHNQLADLDPRGGMPAFTDLIESLGRSGRSNESPKSKAENNNIEPDNQDNPFDLNWLSNNFGLNLDRVLDSTLDGGSYEIRFKPGHEEAAKGFHEQLKEGNCSWQYWGFSNTVELNRAHKDKLIAYAKQLANPSLLKAENNNIEPDNQDNPFDLNWLSNNFGLNLDRVLDTLEGSSYKIRFKPGHEEAAKGFHEQLKEGNCSWQYWGFSNTVELNRSHKDKLLEYAKQLANSSLSKVENNNIELNNQVLPAINSSSDVSNPAPRGSSSLFSVDKKQATQELKSKIGQNVTENCEKPSYTI